jgi:OFA family oxalate/formate antiporter-like MFS transporter
MNLLNCAVPMETTNRNRNRWLIAIAGALLQLCLGAVYAWSYFQKPLVETYGWKNTEVAWTFSFAICFLGLAAAVGGVALPRFGPRKLAIAGSLLYGAGYWLAAVALHTRSLTLLWIGYGLVGGIGLGLGYVTPVATAAKWFPDKKGLVTGMVVMGFGFGALLMSKVIAPALGAVFHGNLPRVFAAAGTIVGGGALVASLMLRNPEQAGTTPEHDAGPVLPRLLSARFALLWLIFFCNIAAGIAIIGFQSPLLQDLWKRMEPAADAAKLAACGATLIAVSSVFNGIGRFFWGGLSDRIGRVATFRIMLATQILAFVGLMATGNPWLFGALVCYVLLCYGGGFGTMPSFVLDEFGSGLMPVMYGCILTAWSAAGVVGPQIVAALKDRCGASAATYSFGVGAALLATGLLVSLLARPQQRR